MNPIARLYSELNYKEVCNILGIAPALRGPAKKAQIAEIRLYYDLHEATNHRFTLAPLGYKANKQNLVQQKRQQKRQEKIERGIIIIRKNYEIDLANKKGKHEKDRVYQVLLWFLENSNDSDETGYISGFFSCLKFMRAVGDLEALYQAYPRDVVVQANQLIGDKLRQRYKNYTDDLVQRKLLTRKCHYLLSDDNHLTEDDYNRFSNLAMEDINRHYGCNATKFTVQMNPSHKEKFDQRMKKYIEAAFDSTIRCKVTRYSVLDSGGQITQQFYDEVMVFFIEVMRETVLRSVREHKTDYHDEFLRQLLDFIQEYMVYVSPQGEEIRTRDDMIEREAGGAYRDNACVCLRYCEGNLYTVKSDDPYHQLYYGMTSFLKAAPVLGKLPETKPFEWYASDEKGINKVAVVDIVAERSAKEVEEARARVEPYLENPELQKSDNFWYRWCASSYVQAVDRQRQDMFRLFRAGLMD